MKNIWTNHRISVIVLGYAVAVAVVSYFVFWPLVADIRNTADAIQENLLDQQIDKTRLQNLAGMQKDGVDYQAEKNSLNVILDPGSEVGFIEGVEAIASNTKNAINLQIGDHSDPAQIAKMGKVNAAASKSKAPQGILDSLTHNNYYPVQINLTGDYSGLVNFIHALENMQFYVNIVSISVNKNQVPADSSGSVSGNIFSSQPNAGNSNADQKEVLNTIINAVVYTQK
ncbi:MAG: hypothetical protein P4L62_01240 [Candidatus Pacebacteria bacterium]|nr:hypothetical protein [Candidatus Paceibacterota bacterium]MDR3582972.1 hypothetical protein [Candidatus Paceibacterota bacterium]